MASPLSVRVLFVDDSADDVELLLRALEHGGFGVDWQRVDDETGFAAALDAAQWDVILCDYAMSRFDPARALRLLQLRSMDIPLLVVSGTITDQAAVDLMRAGARDYVIKDNLPRLVPAIIRELRDAIARREGREAHRLMRESEQFFRTVVEHVSDLIAVTDLDARILRIAPSVQHVIGRNAEEVIGASILDLIIPQDRPLSEQKLRSLRDTPGTRIVSEVGFARTDGTVRVLECVASSFTTANGERAIAINARDVTAELALQQSEARLRQAQKMEAIGRLAGGIAHDFNNLLTAILGYGDLVADQLSGHPAAGDVEQILDAGRRAAALTRQLLAFSRQQVLAPQILSPNDVVEDMAQLLGRLLGNSVRLTLEMQDDIGHIKVDRGQLEQVLMNLAVNARDAMPDGGQLTISTTSVALDGPAAAAAAVAPGPHVLLAVSDTGTAMDKATLARIFEPFFTTKDKGHGTGLGLATVYGIVTQSGGGVEVESSIGVGTTFRVYFPEAVQ